MRFKKRYALIAIILLQFLLCSCAKGEQDLIIEISPTDKSINNLTSKIYDESQLSEIASFNGLIDDLNAQYPIECIREDNGTYRVSYLGDGFIAVLLFDSNGNRLLGNFYSAQRLKSDFNQLVKGQTLNEVKAIDPNGEYLFLFTGRNDSPKISSHYTKDGYLITIEYGVSNEILSISEELI